MDHGGAGEMDDIGRNLKDDGGCTVGDKGLS